MSLFKRSEPRDEWRGIPWEGVEVSSESARKKDVFRRGAEAAIAAAKSVHSPVLIGVGEEIQVASDGSMWMSGIRVMWPAGSDGAGAMNDGLAPFMNLQRYDLGRPYVSRRQYNDFADALSFAEWGGSAAGVWRINFNAKAETKARTSRPGRVPQVDEFVAKRDLQALLKACEYPDDGLRRAAMKGAVVVAIESQDDNSITMTSRVLATRASQGDDIALETLVSILRQGFKEYGLRGYSGAMENRAYDLLPTVGPRIVPLVAPLLDHEEWLVRRQAVGVLGRAGDVSVLRRIVELGLTKTSEGETDTAMRQQCFVALVNLYSADGDGFVEVAGTMGREEREWLAGAATFSAGGSRTVTEEDRQRASKISPERFPPLSDKQKAAIERNRREQERRDRIRAATREAEQRRPSGPRSRPKLP
jgi:hypothetical protein